METPVRAYEEKLYKQEIFGVFGPFFLLFSPSKDQREARKGESTRSTRTLRNLFVYHALGGIQVRRRVSYSLASRRNISLSSFEASILPS